MNAIVVPRVMPTAIVKPLDYQQNLDISQGFSDALWTVKQNVRHLKQLLPHITNQKDENMVRRYIDSEIQYHKLISDQRRIWRVSDAVKGRGESELPMWPLNFSKVRKISNSIRHKNHWRTRVPRPENNKRPKQTWVHINLEPVFNEQIHRYRNMMQRNPQYKNNLKNPKP